MDKHQNIYALWLTLNDNLYTAFARTLNCSWHHWLQRPKRLLGTDRLLLQHQCSGTSCEAMLEKKKILNVSRHFLRHIYFVKHMTVSIISIISIIAYDC